MTDKDKKILQVCGALVPKLTDVEKDKFATFVEVMAFLCSHQRPSYGHNESGKEAHT